jgi:hypothetical protein
MTFNFNTVTALTRHYYREAGWDVDDPNSPGYVSPEEQTRREMDRGLYDKYVVRRLDADPTGKHAECWYFVLDLEHDPYAYSALDMYASTCADKYPVLSYELKQRLKQFQIDRAADTMRLNAIELLHSQGYQVIKNGEIQT